MTDDYVTILQDLPDEGIRCPGGLALRLSQGNGMAVLGCSRVDEPPIRTELTAVCAAIHKVYVPPVLLQADVMETRWVKGQRHYIHRFYWPLASVSVVPSWSQASLFTAVKTAEKGMRNGRF